VFKTTNGGVSWSPASTGLANLSVRALAVDPVAPNVVYAGTGGGISKSTDGGGSWGSVFTGSVRALAIDPTAPGTVYAGTTGGVVKSTDAGGTWVSMNSGITENDVRGVVVDPQTPSIVYVATAGGGVFRTVTGGTAWAPLNAGLTPDNDDVRALAISPSGACVHAATFGGGIFDFATVLEPCTGLIPPLVAAVLPSSRSIQVASTATVFASIINPSSVTAEACSIGLATSVPGIFLYQTTDPSTNQLIGTPNTPVDIPGGATQSFLIALTPTTTTSGVDVAFKFSCSNTATDVLTIVGVNTLLLVVSNSSVPDIIALAAADQGIVNIPSSTSIGVFAVATANVGSAGTIRVTADTGTLALPVTLVVCETDPATGVCKDPPAASVQRGIGSGQTPTFAVFAIGNEPIGFDPALNRVFVRFKDGSGVTRGSTSVAVRTTN
jgi:hypothetical protein